MTALSLSAVGGLGGKSGVALSADHLVASVLSSESSEGGFNLDGSLTATSESEHQVEGGLLLDVVIRQGSSIFQLLSSKDESLLIRRDTFLVLNLGLHVFDGVGRLHIKGDSLTGQSLDEDLHFSSI